MAENEHTSGSTGGSDVPPPPPQQDQPLDLSNADLASIDLSSLIPKPKPLAPEETAASPAEALPKAGETAAAISAAQTPLETSPAASAGEMPPAPVSPVPSVPAVSTPPPASPLAPPPSAAASSAKAPSPPPHVFPPPALPDFAAPTAPNPPQQQETKSAVFPASTPPAAPPPADAPASTAQEPQVRMARIISEVKLPERRESRGAPQKEPRVYDTLLASSVDEVPPSTQEPVSAPSAAGEPARASASTDRPAGAAGVSAESGVQKAALSSVHTLKDDLQSVVHDDKMSVVRAAALEEDRKAKEKAAAQAQAPKSHAIRNALVGLFVVIALGGAGFYAVYSVLQVRASAPAPTTPVEPSLLFAEQTREVFLSGPEADLTLALEEIRAPGTLGSIARLSPYVSETADDGTSTDRQATIGEFFAAVGADAPDELLRALRGDFFFGIHTTDTQAAILALPVSSYERAFAGMLAWERTMADDLSPLFGIPQAAAADETMIPTPQEFADTLVKNYDVRVLFAPDGSPELLYSFPTRTMLIVGRSPDSFLEAISRLRAARQL